jgi:hypothetical protein
MFNSPLAWAGGTKDALQNHLKMCVIMTSGVTEEYAQSEPSVILIL